MGPLMTCLLVHRKRWISVILLSLLLLNTGSLGATSFVEDLHLTPASFLFVGGSGPGNYTTIQAALDAAQPGDTVFVYDDASPYFEHLQMRTTGVTLQGEQNTTTIVDGNQTGTVISVLADTCTLRTLTVRGSGPATMDAGILINGASAVTITGATITSSSMGILITTGSDHATVTACAIHDCQTGISTIASSHLNLTHNILSTDGTGAYCSYGDHLYLFENTFDCKWSGLQLDRLTNSSAIKNTIRKSNDGLIGILCTNLTLMDNTVTRTRWMNVRLSDCLATQFLGNIITDSDGIGVYISKSQGTIVTQNLVTGNDDGILLEYTNQTQVVGNTFLNLKNDAYVITATLNHNGNRWSHNYYTKPRHLPYLISGRLKHNGHNIPFISWDLHPLTAPPTTRPQTASSLLSHEILYVGGTGPGNYTTIQAAVDNATDGDTIYIYPGTYTGGIILSKALTLQGADTTTTIIDSGGYDDGITILQSGCTIQDLTIQHSHFAITALTTTNLTITAMDLHDNFHAIHLRNTTTVSITHNTIQNNQYGIRLYDANLITVTRNTLHNLKLNAYFVGTTPASLHNTWDRNYWDRPRLTYLIHGKYFPSGQPASLALNLDHHPLLRPEPPGFQGNINKEQRGYFADSKRER